MLNVRTILVQYREGVRVVFFFARGNCRQQAADTLAGCAVGAGAGTGPCVLVIRLIVAAE